MQQSNQLVQSALACISEQQRLVIVRNDTGTRYAGMLVFLEIIQEFCSDFRRRQSFH
jgi:hypothetical protein